MSAHPGYFPDPFGSQQFYRCATCQFDCFSEESMRNHVVRSHGILHLPEEDISISDWIDRHKTNNPLMGKTIALGLLTWNTEDASFLSAYSLVTEKMTLERFGIKMPIIWVDNGSTDGTVPVLKRLLDGKLCHMTVFNQNMGQSIARNIIIQRALSEKCDYLLMVDGDISIIQYSSFAMGRYLQQAAEHIGCIGMNSRNCTHARDSFVPQFCRKIEEWMVSADPNIAWTNYGLFRREVLELCQFDEKGPFFGPGWGFEDDDYALQMNSCGFLSLNTRFFRHMHRRRHSSIVNLGAEVAADIHKKRKEYLLDKWGRSRTDAVQRRLRAIANQTMPDVDYKVR